MVSAAAGELLWEHSKRVMSDTHDLAALAGLELGLAAAIELGVTNVLAVTLSPRLVGQVCASAGSTQKVCFVK